MAARTARPRSTVDVVGRALVTGLAAGAPAAFLGLYASVVAETLHEGSRVGEALRAGLLTSEDWEILPFWLFGAVVLGGVVATVAAGVWLFVARRAPARPWLAALGAAATAAVLSALPLVASAQQVALATAPVVALVTLLAAPRVCLERSTRA